MDSTHSFDDLQAFHQRYLAGEKATLILKEMGRKDLVPSQIMKAFPPYEIEGTCSVCRGDLHCCLLSRTEHQRKRSAMPFCKDCGHREEAQCPCQQCKKQRAEERDRQLAAQEVSRAARRTAIETWIATQPARVLEPVPECDPRCLLALAADLYTTALRPEDRGARQVLHAYRELGIARAWRVPDIRRSDIDAFHESGQVIEEMRQHVAYRWNVDANVTWKGVCDALRRQLVGHNKVIEAIWLEIMTEECLGFLEWQLNEVKLPTGRLLHPIHAVIQRLLTETSAKLVCKFIRMSVAGAAEYSLRRECKSGFVAVGGISDRLEYHFRNQRNGKYLGQTFNRPLAYQRSALNRVFFNEILEGTTDIGFEECVATYLPRTPLWRHDLTEGSSDRPVCCDCGATEVTYRQRRSTIYLECRACGQVQIFEADPSTP